MAKVELEESSEPASAEPEMVSQTAGSLLMSVAFWLTLLAASLMYAAVTLSPKLADWILVRQQYLSNAERLKQLEDDVDYLERVAAALKSDPEFALRLVRANHGSATEDSEFVPVARELVFGGSPKSSVSEPKVMEPAVANLVFHLASHERHRGWLLSGSVCLTLLAFVLLNDAGVEIVRSFWGGFAVLLSAAISRYRTRHSTDAAPEAELNEVLVE